MPVSPCNQDLRSPSPCYALNKGQYALPRPRSHPEYTVGHHHACGKNLPSKQAYHNQQPRSEDHRRDNGTYLLSRLGENTRAYRSACHRHVEHIILLFWQEMSNWGNHNVHLHHGHDKPHQPERFYCSLERSTGARLHVHSINLETVQADCNQQFYSAFLRRVPCRVALLGAETSTQDASTGAHYVFCSVHDCLPHLCIPFLSTNLNQLLTALLVNAAYDHVADEALL
mmetsp:Transcript_489/g.1195  ORF Transcript_489/g.1195 Transcript_489/m.1195 type:complete len:228 (+) Transcript_489:382-1065(+)